MSTVRLGLVQLAMGEDAEENIRQALEGVREAAEQGAQVICLPELFASRYFCQTEDARHFDLAEAIPGPTTARFAALAARHDAVLILSQFEKRAPGLYHNTAAVVDGEAGFLGKYRKMHIPDDPRYYEKFYFAPGDLGFRAWKTRHGTLGVLICWDQWYPEGARLTALQGAEVLFYPTAIGWHPAERESHGRQQHAAWETIQRSHAVANGCFVVAVNRVGFEPDPSGSGDSDGIRFWGQSFVTAPDGQVVARLSDTEPDTRVVEIDMGDIEEQRRGWPFFRDRRVDAYHSLTSRYLDTE